MLTRDAGDEGGAQREAGYPLPQRVQQLERVRLRGVQGGLMGNCWRCDTTQHTSMRGTTQHSQPECMDNNARRLQPAPPCSHSPSPDAGRTWGGRFMASSVRLEMCCSGMSMYLQTWEGGGGKGEMVQNLSVGKCAQDRDGAPGAGTAQQGATW